MCQRNKIARKDKMINNFDELLVALDNDPRFEVFEVNPDGDKSVWRPEPSIFVEYKSTIEPDYSVIIFFYWVEDRIPGGRFKSVIASFRGVCYNDNTYRLPEKDIVFEDKADINLDEVVDVAESRIPIAKKTVASREDWHGYLAEFLPIIKDEYNKIFDAYMTALDLQSEITFGKGIAEISKHYVEVVRYLEGSLNQYKKLITAIEKGKDFQDTRYIELQKVLRTFNEYDPATNGDKFLVSLLAERSVNCVKSWLETGFDWIRPFENKKRFTRY